MPSISSIYSDDPFTNSATATVGHPDDDKNMLDVLKNAFNDADIHVRYSVDIISAFIDYVIEKLEWVLEKLERQQEDQVFDHWGIFEELKNYIRDLFHNFYNHYLLVEGNLNTCMNVVHNCIYPFEADSYKHYINDCHKDRVNEMIATYLYRQGLFDVVDPFVDVAGVEELRDKVTGLTLRPQFKNFQDITNAVKKFETDLPLQWIAENRERLGETKASELEYKIHVNKYLRMVEESGARTEVRQEALNYAKAHLNHFANEHNRDEMSKLFGCVMYESFRVRLVADSRYCHFFDGSYQRNLLAEIEEQFYIMMGQFVKDPLSTVTSVGAKFLSGVCKAANIVIKDHSCRWAVTPELPLYLNLDEELKFHSQFACPLTKVVMENGFNPPVALVCNHVISFKMMLCHTVKPTGNIICPYCISFTPKGGYKTIYF